MKEMKTYFVKYKDQGGFGCGEEVESSSKHEAIKKVQSELIKEGNYMYRLVDIYEIEENSSCDDCNQEWKLDDGTVLEQEHQDTLNDAMNSLVNKDGLTLREAIELKSKNE
jgi:hypothetical protein